MLSGARDQPGRQNEEGLNLLASASGNMSLLMVAGIGLLVLVGGAVLDFVSLSNQRMSLQTLADRAAIASAQELIVSAASDARVTAVAEAFVRAGEPDLKTATTATVVEGGHGVTVAIQAPARTFFAGPMSNVDTLTAEATAEVAGGGYVCMIGLDPDSVATLNMMNSARLTAQKCAVYSNSTSEKSLWVHDSARVNAETICVAGGVQGPTEYFTNAKPTEDCPQLADPLSARPNPHVGSLRDCDHRNMAVRPGEVVRLKPGIYCGGLNVMGGTAKLDPGIYAIVDGQLQVNGGGVLAGENVGFFLSGPASVIRFARKSSISLSAPRKGDMAGLLFFEDRTSRFSGYHQITSQDARNLVGTIYVPKSKLLIDASNPVADRSDYTIIIAREFELRDGPELVLNTDYEDSPIPVPEGVGDNVRANVRLTR